MEEGDICVHEGTTEYPIKEFHVLQYYNHRGNNKWYYLSYLVLGIRRQGEGFALFEGSQGTRDRVRGCSSRDPE